MNTIKVFHLSISDFCKEADGAFSGAFQLGDDFSTFQRINEKFLLAILSECSGQTIVKEDIAYGKWGKPFVNPSKELDLHFNVSHTKNDIVVAVATFPIGIDMERMQDSFPKIIVPKLLHPNDSWTIQSAPDFYQLWTIKEAFSKFIGEGLSLGLKNIQLLSAHGRGMELSTSKVKGQACEVKGIENHFCVIASERVHSNQIWLLDSSVSIKILTEYLSMQF